MRSEAMVVDRPQIDPEYARSWRDLRRREFLWWLVMLMFMPGILLIMLALGIAFGDVPEHFGLWFGGVWIATFVVVSVYRQSFRCPRCNRSFFWRRNGYNPQAQYCAHCQLPRWALTDSDSHPVR
jgi:hypothetical protein